MAPLVPDRPLLQGLLHPQAVVRLLLVLLVIQSLAHVGRRLLQARQAMPCRHWRRAVSSTATIASLGMEVREGRVRARDQAGAAVLSCVATMVQIVVVAATVQPDWLASVVARAGWWASWRLPGAGGVYAAW